MLCGQRDNETSRFPQMFRERAYKDTTRTHFLIVLSMLRLIL